MNCCILTFRRAITDLQLRTPHADFEAFDKYRHHSATSHLPFVLLSAFVPTVETLQTLHVSITAGVGLIVSFLVGNNCFIAFSKTIGIASGGHPGIASIVTLPAAGIMPIDEGQVAELEARAGVEARSSPTTKRSAFI